MGDNQQLSMIEEQAFQLSRCAIALDAANEARQSNPAGLVGALNANLELWVALRSVVMKAECTLADATKQNLVRLSEFVAAKTFEGIDKLTDEGVKSLVNINLQISEGLLEGAKAKA